MKWRPLPRPGRDSAALLAALVLLVIALLVPPVPLPRATYDQVIVFDLTQSMWVEDVQIDGRPATRIALAREAARRALRALPCGSRIGWGAFTEYRSLLLLAPIEVCGHYNDLLATLDQIDERMRWGNASEIAKGVFWALRAVKSLDPVPVLVFVTDGQEAPPRDSATLPLFDDLQPGQVRGLLLGVGSATPGPIPRQDSDGQRIGFWAADDVVQPDHGARIEHLSARQDDRLKALARQVAFDYHVLADPAELGPWLRDARHATRRPVSTNLAALPAVLAFAVLVWRFRPRIRD
jgi:mxaL protein